MKIAKKIMLSMLIAGSTGFAAFAMEETEPTPTEPKTGLLDMTGEAFEQILSQTISGLDLNTYKGFKKAFAELCKKRRVSKAFRNFLTTQKIADLLLEKGLDVRKMKTGYLDDSNEFNGVRLALYDIDLKRLPLEALEVLIATVDPDKRDAFIATKNAYGDIVFHDTLFACNPKVMKLLIDAVSPGKRDDLLWLRTIGVIQCWLVL